MNLYNIYFHSSWSCSHQSTPTNERWAAQDKQK